jgi:NAD(P)H-dependent flavin oxidoreductase YrpB (nitropropane dioxygenase family)
MLSTSWSRRMGLRAPIVNAPMGGVVGGRLAAAVTAAGGLGMVGMGTAGSTSSLHAELPDVHATFGIGLVDWVIRKEPELLDAVLDVVSVPVLAAGGIASPRSLAAVLAAGASGAWLGTVLSASPEALTTDASRRALVAARETDTASTRVFDIVRGLPWSKRFPSRVLRNDFVARWTGHEDALADEPAALDELAAAIAADDRRTAPVDAGQGVGMVTGVAPVAQVIDRLCEGAEKLLTNWHRET